MITDSIVVGQQRLAPPYSDSAEQVILFIKCTSEATTGTLRVRPELEAAIRDQIAHDLSRRHVPAFIFETQVVPYNANGKKLEIQAKAILGAGASALGHLKLTAEEYAQLKWYERFYQVERVIEGFQSHQPTSKL